VVDGEVQQERTRSLASIRRVREKEKQRRREGGSGEATFVVREVRLPEVIVVSELANRMAVRTVDVVKKLMTLGVMASPGQSIDADTAELVIEEFGHKIRRVSESDVEIGLFGEEEADENLVSRPPVVTVMGHVDHGKTSLLDALRKANVVDGEAGGITQHIGAYQVTTEAGDKVTFLDTPGHAAFSAMRQRGAKLTDLVILVVAADDTVQPQTIEAINHARAAEAPMIVALNKCDRPESDPDRIKQELLTQEVISEDFGGDIQMINVSATRGDGLDELVEAISLQAELLELKANPDREARGGVVEAQLDRGRGPVATILVQNGTLRRGDVLVAGAEWGRVRAMVDEHGEQIKEAGPSTPVEVLGLSGVPMAGDEVVVVPDDSRAREVSEYRQRLERDKRTALAPRGTIDDMFGKIASGESAELPIIVKSDVQGSQEAIVAAIEKLANDEVSAKVIHSGVGAINESDVTLASSAGGFIVGFNVRASGQARQQAQRDGVDIRYYSIIYELLDDLKAAVEGLLAPEQREKFIGNAEIREVFNITKVGKIAGCRIVDGVVRRGAGVRLLRDNVVIHQGKLATLKRFKEEVREVREGFECGMAFERYEDLQVGDVIECYEIEEVARTL
jgi:translation initiation factor IF-2